MNGAKNYLLLLLLIGGFIPWVVPVMFFWMDDYYQWAIEGSNEAVAWSFILSSCHVAALIWAITLLRSQPAFGSLVASLAAFGLIITYSFGRFSQLGPSSNQDSEKLELLDFWLDGGWLAALILIIPVSLFYLVALTLRRNRTREA